MCVCIFLIISSCSNSDREIDVSKKPGAFKEMSQHLQAYTIKSEAIKAINDDFEKVRYHYDQKVLKRLLSHTEQIELNNENKIDLLLMKASINSLIADIHYYQRNRNKFEETALKTIKLLDEAKKKGHNSIVSYTLYAKTCGMLCSINMLHAFKYGLKGMDSSKKAYEINPNNLYAQIAMGNLYLGAPSLIGGDLKKAKNIFSDLSSKHPNNPDIKYLLARTYFKLGKKEKAKILLKEIVGKIPRYLPANDMLKEIG